jgi:hypothetical protein
MFGVGNDWVTVVCCFTMYFLISEREKSMAMLLFEKLLIFFVQAPEPQPTSTTQPSFAT